MKWTEECITDGILSSHKKYKSYYDAERYKTNAKEIQAYRKLKRENDLETKIKHTLRNSKQGAKTKGFDFSITYEYVLDVWNHQAGKCALSGEIMVVHGDRYLSNMLSLDRIDSSIGYIKGNVQWVCVKYNMMKAHATLEDFINMCKNVVEYHK